MGLVSDLINELKAIAAEEPTTIPEPEPEPEPKKDIITQDELTELQSAVSLMKERNAELEKTLKEAQTANLELLSRNNGGPQLSNTHDILRAQSWHPDYKKGN